MFCTKCGNQVPDGFRFCDKCGNPMTDVPVMQAMPQVNAEPQPLQPNENAFFQAPTDDMLLDNASAGASDIGKTVAAPGAADIGKTVAAPGAADLGKTVAVMHNEPAKEAQNADIPVFVQPEAQASAVEEQPVVEQRIFTQPEQPVVEQRIFTQPEQPAFVQPEAPQFNQPVAPQPAFVQPEQPVFAQPDQPAFAQQTPQQPYMQPQMQPVQPQVNPNMDPYGQPKPKKKNTGLKVFLIVLIILVVLAGTLAALWFFAVPKSTKNFLSMNSGFKKQDYSKVMEYLEFTEDSIATDLDGFSTYAEKNITSELNIGSLFNREYYVLDNDGNQIILTYDEETEKFDGDVFTYSFVIMEPAVAQGKSDYVSNTIAGFRDVDKYTYTFNAVLGDDKTTYTNEVEVTLALADGKIDKISSISCETYLYDAKDFAHVEGNTLYFDALEVDEDYAMRVAQALADFDSDAVDAAKKGKSYDEFIKDYEDYLVADAFEEAYGDYTSAAKMYDKLGYNKKLTVDGVKGIDLYHVGDTSIIFVAEMTREESSTLSGKTMTPTETAVLIRPLDTGMRIVFNYFSEEYVAAYAEKLDENLSYDDAWQEVAEENDLLDEASDEENFGSYMTDSQIDAYIDTLLDFVRTYKDARFMLIPRNDCGGMPLLCCIPGDSSDDTCYFYYYNKNTGRLDSMGNAGTNGECWYDPSDSLLYFQGSGTDYFWCMYYEVWEGNCTKIFTATATANGSKVVYTINDEKVSKDNYDKLYDEFEEIYPDSNFYYIAYKNLNPITDGEIIRAFF